MSSEFLLEMAKHTNEQQRSVRTLEQQLKAAEDGDQHEQVLFLQKELKKVLEVLRGVSKVRDHLVGELQKKRVYDINEQVRYECLVTIGKYVQLVPLHFTQASMHDW